MLLGHLYFSLEKCLLRYFAHFLIGLFVFLILSSMSCLYILEINLLSVSAFANIFSHFEGCLFILFMVSFTVKKLLTLIWFHLFIFVFIFIILGCGSKKTLLWFISTTDFSVFSSQSLMVSGVTLGSLAHLDLIFVCGVRRVLTPLSHAAVHMQGNGAARLLGLLNERLSSLHCVSWPPLSQMR